MAKDAITMFKEAAAQLQREEAYLALEGTRKKNDEDEALQQLIGDFNLARIDLNSELSKSADKDQDKVNELNVKVNQLYNDIMANESMAAYNEAKAELESVMNYVNAIINTAVNGRQDIVFPSWGFLRDVLRRRHSCVKGAGAHPDGPGLRPGGARAHVRCAVPFL